MAISGTMATLYHPESRSHFLAVECGGLLSGSAPLYDEGDVLLRIARDSRTGR